MLDPQIKLGTSTPKADPSGDYAWEVFRKADKLKPGSFATLEKQSAAAHRRAHRARPRRKAARSMAGSSREGAADIFLTYCTNALAAQQENPGQQIVQLPDALAVGADYGLTVMNGASPRRINSRCSSSRRKASACWPSTALPRPLCRNRSVRCFVRRSSLSP